MEGLIQFARNMGAGRLLMIGIVGVATFAMFALMISRVQTAPMAVLYADLEPADASTIVQQLETQGIPYDLGANGRMVSIPRDQVDRMRLSLAGQGLSGNVMGKEIFDRDASFGRTSFELNVNYLRAVEGELTRTIKSFQSVSDVRVHVVLPERRPFERQASEPSASITVRTSGGGLSQSQARTIQSLVASSVPGLSVDKVTIADTSGRLLVDGTTDSGMLGGFSDLEEARLGKEQLYRSKIENILAQRVGQGNVRAEVSVEMDMERTTTSQTTFDPDGQVVVSSQTSEDTSNEASAASGGQVTVGNNIPNGNNQGQGGATSPQNTSSKLTESTNFENSKTEVVSVKEPGQVTRINVSVIVDGIRGMDADGTTPTYQDRPQSEIEQFQNLVRSAIPYDEARGDIITVASMRFADPPTFEVAEEGFTLMGISGDKLWRAAEAIGVFFLAALFILLIVRPIIVKAIDSWPEAPPAPEPGAHLAAPSGQPVAQIGGPITADVVAAAAAGDEAAAAAIRAAKAAGDLNQADLRIDSKIDVAQVEGRVQDSAIKKVAEIIKSNPDDSAAIVRQWLYAD